MKYKLRNKIQIFFTTFIIISSFLYYLYINGSINFRLLSIGDLNPYGGWSEVKSAFTEISYRFRGITKPIALTIAIALTSLLMGRFFCGFICPIGALQDFSKFLGSKLNLREFKIPNKFNLKLNLIKYILLVALLILSILGLGNLLSSFSPWLAYLNLFLGFKIYLGTYILIGIFILSLFFSRLFCRYFCPLGALQSLMYALGPFKIKTNTSCKSCNNCLKNCPVAIERAYNLEISPECINCLKCVDANCIKNTSGYSLNFVNKKISINKYIEISLVIFLSLTLFLPLINFTSQASPMESFKDLAPGKYTGTSLGFGGPMQVEVEVEGEKISNIRVLNHRETSGYYEEVFKNISREIIETQSLNIDVISGATVSSRGFINSIKSCINQALKFEEDKS